MRKLIIAVLAVAALGAGCEKRERGTGGAGKTGQEQGTPASQQPYGREQNTNPSNKNEMEQQHQGMGEQQQPSKNEPGQQNPQHQGR